MDAVNLILGFGIGIILVVLLVAVAVYIVSALAFQKCLKHVGYQNAWLAWIPFGCYYALADALEADEAEIFPNVRVPMNIFKLWWILLLILPFLPLGVFATFITTAVRVIFLGWNFGQLYDKIDGGDNKVIGYISGWITIIAVIKFLSIKD